MKKTIAIAVVSLAVLGSAYGVWVYLDHREHERLAAEAEMARAAALTRYETEQAAKLAAQLAAAEAESRARRKDPATIAAEERAAREKAQALLEKMTGPPVSEIEQRWGKRAYACKRDADCDTSSRHDGHCCFSCASAAYAKQFIRALERHQRQHCADAECPRRSCGRKSHEQIPEARCIGGRCEKTYPYRKQQTVDKLLDEVADDMLQNMDL